MKLCRPHDGRRMPLLDCAFQRMLRNCEGGFARMAHMV